MSNRYALNIKDLRKKKKLSQAEFANIIDVKRSTYANYEADIEPPVEVLKSISEKFNIKLDELLSENYIENLNKSQRDKIAIIIDEKINQAKINITGIKLPYKMDLINSKVEDDGPVITIELLQYQVDVLINKVALAQIEIEKQNGIILLLQRAAEDKDLIIELQNKLLK